MLAYLFWHWTRPGTGAEEYEQRLQDFHQALRAWPPVGFRSSAVFRSPGEPWIKAEGNVYEDWYLLDDSGGLDVLNDAAVAPPLAETHDRIAAFAGGGAAGLYRPWAGTPDLAGARFAHWFNKPAGMRYAEFQATAEAWTENEASLWGRQMVLGPTPEFCLLAGLRMSLPSDLSPIVVELTPVWMPA